MDQQQQQFVKAFTSAVARAETGEAKCLIGPPQECSDKIIEAHSIQRTKLRLISDTHGEVLIMTPDLQKLGRMTTRNWRPYLDERAFEKRSINNRLMKGRMACEYHDNKVFSEIEDRELDPHNPYHCLLLSYRAAIFHLYKKMVVARAFSTMSIVHPDFHMMQQIAVEDMQIAQRAKDGLADELRVTSDARPSVIEHRTILIGSPPRVAANGVITRGSRDALTRRELAGVRRSLMPVSTREMSIVLTVYPDPAREVAIVSFPKGRESLARIVMPALDERNRDHVGALLSKTLIEETENIMDFARSMEFLR